MIACLRSNKTSRDHNHPEWVKTEAKQTWIDRRIDPRQRPARRRLAGGGQRVIHAGNLFPIKTASAIFQPVTRVHYAVCVYITPITRGLVLSGKINNGRLSRVWGGRGLPAWTLLPDLYSEGCSIRGPVWFKDSTKAFLTWRPITSRTMPREAGYLQEQNRSAATRPRSDRSLLQRDSFKPLYQFDHANSWLQEVLSSPNMLVAIQNIVLSRPNMLVAIQNSLILPEHARSHSKHSLILPEHARSLSKHSLILPEHARSHSKHSLILPEHARSHSKQSYTARTCS
ncbi:hypothetical protein J6590_080885 [Homalodisca vitripennis]|nr:hypothetical protein J6590_080885 [Homalodisca vitripennis]